MIDGNFSKMMLIDLNLGVIGNQTKKSGSGTKATYYKNLTDFGMVNISYDISSLDQNVKVAFNVYAYNNQTVQGQGVNWLNRVYTYDQRYDGLIVPNSSGWVYTPI